MTFTFLKGFENSETKLNKGKLIRPIENMEKKKKWRHRKDPFYMKSDYLMYTVASCNRKGCDYMQYDENLPNPVRSGLSGGSQNTTKVRDARNMHGKVNM